MHLLVAGLTRQLNSPQQPKEVTAGQFTTLLVKQVNCELPGLQHLYPGSMTSGGQPNLHGSLIGPHF
jgi:hypothetical protein